MHEISENTKAILLLTAPLIVSSKAADSAKILSLKEYNSLARWLHSLGFQPQDLLGPELTGILPKLPTWLDRARLESLLHRGFLLGQALTEWQRRSIWVVSRADPSYPKRLRTKLREQAPAVLYGCGERALLERGGLAVVGSRKISEEQKDFTASVGGLAAEARVSIVSGAARGIDSSAMEGALANGGSVVGVMADSLGRAALAKSNREALQDGRLVLISSYDPSAGFNVGHAMQRNKAIYALADAGLVVTADFNKGGTWAGAVEQLEKYHYVPVFVRNGENCGQGNAVLLRRGGKPWPNPRNENEFKAAMDSASELLAAQPEQDSLPLTSREEPAVYNEIPAPVSTVVAMDKAEPSQPETPDSPGEELFRIVRNILRRELAEARTESEVASLLNVATPQAKAWLKRLVDELVLEKVTKPKPVRFRASQASERLL